MAEGVPVQQLGLQELNTVKEQLDGEIKQLNASLTQLTLAGNKYRFSEEAVNSVSPANQGKAIMVPLSSSLYINGEEDSGTCLLYTSPSPRDRG